MVRVETSVRIERPVGEVFEYIADPTKLPEWNTIIESATPSDTPVRAGSKVQMHARFLGKKIDYTAEVTEFERNQRFVTRTQKPFALTNINIFAEEAGGTRVVATYEADPGAFFKLGESIVSRIAKKQLQAQLETVKELLEAAVPAQR